MVVQSVQTFAKKTGLVMARSLSSNDHGSLTTVVANITDEPIAIDGNITIALAMPIDTVLEQ